MNHTQWIILALAGIMMLGACKDKVQPKDTAEYADSYVLPKPGAPIKMAPSAKEYSAKWNGATCKVLIQCMPSDSLPMVENEYGQAFVDNIFDLKVIDVNQSALFHRTVRKSQFLSHINDSKVRSDYASKAILKSVSVDQDSKTGEFHYFIVSLQAPEAAEDDYVLFKYYPNDNIEQLDEDMRVNWDGQPPVQDDDEEWLEE